MTYIWTCKIGEQYGQLREAHLRSAVIEVYREKTGREPDFVFSGWDGELTEAERAVVENRIPEPQSDVRAERDALVEALKEMTHRAQVLRNDLQAAQMPVLARIADRMVHEVGRAALPAEQGQGDD